MQCFLLKKDVFSSTFVPSKKGCFFEIDYIFEKGRTAKIFAKGTEKTFRNPNSTSSTKGKVAEWLKATDCKSVETFST